MSASQPQIIPGVWKLLTPCPSFCVIDHGDPDRAGVQVEVGHESASFAPDSVPVRLILSRLDEVGDAYPGDPNNDPESVTLGLPSASLHIDQNDMWSLVMAAKQLRSLAASFALAADALDAEETA